MMIFPFEELTMVKISPAPHLTGRMARPILASMDATQTFEAAESRIIRLVTRAGFSTADNGAGMRWRNDSGDELVFIRPGSDGCTLLPVGGRGFGPVALMTALRELDRVQEAQGRGAPSL